MMFTYATRQTRRITNQGVSMIIYIDIILSTRIVEFILQVLRTTIQRNELCCLKKRNIK